MPVIVIILIFSTLTVLLVGIVLMAKGGKINRKYSNKLMLARVALQFLAIAALLATFLIKN